MSYKFKFNCLKVSIIGICMLVFQVSGAQYNFTGLENIVAGKQKLLGSDIILMVATKDTVVYQKSPKLFTGKTQTPIGHSSQWLTAALIMQLVDEGKLSLDDKVVSYLPIFEKYGKNHITIRHCLTHFTGIKSDKTIKLFEKKKFASLDAEVNVHVAKEIQTNPGTEFRYSLIGPAIAARVAEVVMKKKFDVLIQQKLLRPLGMRQTTFSTQDASAPNAAFGARSTANDYMQFLRMLLNNGMHNGQKVLTPESVKELRSITTSPELIKSTPETQKGFDYTYGAWAAEQNTDKQATILTGPSFGGTLPVVDFCRGYAFLLLVKEETEDAKANVYAAAKEVLDAQFKNQCK